MGLHHGNSGLSRRPAGFKWHAPLDASAERAEGHECRYRQHNGAGGDFTDSGLDVDGIEAGTQHREKAQAMPSRRPLPPRRGMPPATTHRRHRDFARGSIAASRDNNRFDGA
jgi:hypothetical protein